MCSWSPFAAGSTILFAGLRGWLSRILFHLFVFLVVLFAVVALTHDNLLIQKRGEGSDANTRRTFEIWKADNRIPQLRNDIRLLLNG